MNILHFSVVDIQTVDSGIYAMKILYQNLDSQEKSWRYTVANMNIYIYCDVYR
jgi:hypothetical protein